MEVHEALRRFRQGTGLKQEEVAEKLGIKRQAYQPYETGKVTPSVNMIIKMANVFDVTTDYLLGRSDTPHPTEFNEREVREAFAFRDAWQKAVQYLPQAPSQASA